MTLKKQERFTFYVDYSSTHNSKALSGKLFADHTVETSYFDEEKYAKDDFKED